MTPIHYLVRFPAPLTHYTEVEAHFSGPRERHLEVFLPVWTPGSYLIREYARHVESLTACDGERRPLQVTKTRKNRWLVSLDNPLDEIVVSYKLYCHELSVRTNYLDETFALLIGAATFLRPVDDLQCSYLVTLELPPEWQGSWSGMPGDGNTFRAADYDTLVDCPIVAGNPSVHRFEVDGKIHQLVNVGEASLWDGAKAVRDVERIVRQHRAMWGSLPYDDYLFLNLITGGGGGLEHRNSMVVMADRFAMRTHPGYIDWLNLVSHEFFHVWNVKRLRPAELGPFDYEHEVYTRNLWIAEGFTEYYGPLALRRSGLTTDTEFLGTNLPAERGNREVASLSGLIEKLQNTPGRLAQPVALASFDAWIKLYRPDENSLNSSISYYTKGAVIAWLLDAKVRAASQDARSLDDVMRAALLRFGGAIGFMTDDFLQLVQEVAGVNLSDWFHQVTESTGELDYSEALTWFGLRFKPVGEVQAAGTTVRAWTGLETKTSNGRLIVTKVPRGTPAWDAGMSADDEIVGIGGYRVFPDDWKTRMEEYQPNEEISLLLARRHRLTTVVLRLGQEPTRGWQVEPDPAADAAQRARFLRWLSEQSS